MLLERFHQFRQIFFDSFRQHLPAVANRGFDTIESKFSNRLGQLLVAKRLEEFDKGADFVALFFFRRVQDLPRRQLARCMRKRAADSPNTIFLNDVLPLD